MGPALRGDDVWFMRARAYLGTVSFYRDRYFERDDVLACANTGDVDRRWMAVMCGVETGGPASGEDVSAVSASSLMQGAR